MKRALAIATLILALPLTAAADQPFSTIGGYGNPTARYPMPVTGTTDIPTYSGGTGGLGNTGAGDVYCVTGSPTKIVRVKSMRISAIANAATVVDVIIFKRSTAAAGGTPVAVTATPHDSNNAAPTASITAYSVSPTPGATVGAVRGAKLAVGTQGNANTIGDETFHFDDHYDQAIVLRGTSQSVCINVTALGAGASIDIGSEHTEEDN